MNQFHAHIYFENRDLEKALKLAELIQSNTMFDHVEVVDKPIGPHPLAMIEVHFNGKVYELVMSWFETHRGNFSVLLHQDTGDDVKDHTDGILWLGRALEIDFSFFELIKKRPDLRIHS